MDKIISDEEAGVIVKALTGMTLDDIQNIINETTARTGKRPTVLAVPRLYLLGLPLEFRDMPYGTVGCFVPDEIQKPNKEEIN